MSRRRITRRHRRTHMNSLPTLKELIQREIADFCATLGVAWRTGNTGSNTARVITTHQ